MKLAADPLCEECARIGRNVPATQVDHRVAIARGGEAFDLENLASLCASCHSRKTASMDGAFGNARKERMRVRGCDVNGMPLDPEHPWNRGAAPPNHGDDPAKDRAGHSERGSEGNRKGGRSWV
jgi:hypothetical protein